MNNQKYYIYLVSTLLDPTLTVISASDKYNPQLDFITKLPFAINLSNRKWKIAVLETLYPKLHTDKSKYQIGYLYCDIVTKNIIGNSQFFVLRSFVIEDTNSDDFHLNTKSFLHPQYIDVERDRIESINIKLDVAFNECSIKDHPLIYLLELTSVPLSPSRPMTYEKRSHYLWLPSHDGLNSRRETNTCTQFTVELNENIQLSGEYEIALIEMISPPIRRFPKKLKFDLLSKKFHDPKAGLNDDDFRYAQALKPRTYPVNTTESASTNNVSTTASTEVQTTTTATTTDTNVVTTTASAAAPVTTPVPPTHVPIIDPVRDHRSRSRLPERPPQEWFIQNTRPSYARPDMVVPHQEAFNPVYYLPPGITSTNDSRLWDVLPKIGNMPVKKPYFPPANEPYMDIEFYEEPIEVEYPYLTANPMLWVEYELKTQLEKRGIKDVTVEKRDEHIAFISKRNIAEEDDYHLPQIGTTQKRPKSFHYTVIDQPASNNVVSIRRPDELNSLETVYKSSTTRRADGSEFFDKRPYDKIETKIDINFDNFLNQPENDFQSGHLMMIKCDQVRSTVIVGSRTEPVLRIVPLASSRNYLDTVKDQKLLTYKFQQPMYIPLAVSNLYKFDISLTDENNKILLAPRSENYTAQTQLLVHIRPVETYETFDL